MTNSKKKYDIIGLGSALVDIQTQVEDSFLENLGYTKGVMSLIDVNERDVLLAKLNHLTQKKSSGGSAANTLASLSSLGHHAAMVGSVGNDPLGHEYKKDLEATQIEFLSNPVEGNTGTSIILISPDAQRTMLTTLGCAPFLSQSHINFETINACKILYIEGYLWDAPDTIDSVKKAIEIAKKNGVRVAFTASDPFCVGRHRDDFLQILNEEADIFFSNADEAKELFKTDSLTEALPKIKNACEFVALTNGATGSFLFQNGKQHEIKSVKTTPIDTTGAGDTYAAGILHGLLNNLSIEEMGKKASEMASVVISRFGARY